jgi:hypothetical protein
VSTKPGQLQPTPKIPRSHFPRIRGWVKYGMTVGQVAEHYGAQIDGSLMPAAGSL